MNRYRYRLAVLRMRLHVILYKLFAIVGVRLPFPTDPSDGWTVEDYRIAEENNPANYDD